MNKPTDEQIAIAVFNHFMNTGKACNIAELAVMLGCSQSRIYSACREPINGVQHTRQSFSVHSKDYGFDVGERSRLALIPSREYMRAQMLSERILFAH